MMFSQRMWALLVKEGYQIIRDPSSMLLAFAFPALLLFIYGYGVSLDANNLPLGVVMEDSSPVARSLVDSFRFSRYFDVQVLRHLEEVEPKIISGELNGYVDIPSYFSRYFYDPNHTAPIQVISDGSAANLAQYVTNYVKAASNNWLVQRQHETNTKVAPIIIPEQRFWYNAELRSRNFLVPGSIAVILTLTGTLLTSVLVAREWERGTMEALMATPVTIWELILGKLIPYFFLGMGSMFVCTFIAYFIFEVPLRGSLFVLMLISSVFLLTALLTGLLISTVAKNQFVAYQIAITAGFLPAFMLSGFIFEITNMPLYIQAITYLVPARYLVTSLQTIFLVGNVWRLLLISMVPMVIYVAFLLYFVLKKTVKRLD